MPCLKLRKLHLLKRYLGNGNPVSAMGLQNTNDTYTWRASYAK